MTQVAVGLGSNVGVRHEHLETAIAEMALCGRVAAVSSLYETAPLGIDGQAPFLNAVSLVLVDREPRDVLATFQAIERANGRRSRPRTSAVAPRAAEWAPPPRGP